MQRLRVRFSRGEEIKFISHLDIMRLCVGRHLAAHQPIAEFSKAFRNKL